MNDILVLHLKYIYFDRVISGKKRVEFREYKPYWKKRLSKPYEYVRFVKGYRSNYSFLYKINSIKVIPFAELPNYAKDFFKGISVYNSKFFAIHFSNCKMVNK